MSRLYLYAIAEQIRAPLPGGFGIENGPLITVTELPLFPHEIRGLAGLREVGEAIYE